MLHSDNQLYHSCRQGERLVDSRLDNDCDVEDKEETFTSSSNVSLRRGLL